MLTPTCWIILGRTVRSFDPCRFAVLGEVSHVTEGGGIQDFPGQAHHKDDDIPCMTECAQYTLHCIT